MQDKIFSALLRITLGYKLTKKLKKISKVFQYK